MREAQHKGRQRAALRQTSLPITAGSQPQDIGNKALERIPLCFLCVILIKEGGCIVYIEGRLFPCSSPKNQTRKCEQTKMAPVLDLSEVLRWKTIILAQASLSFSVLCFRFLCFLPLLFRTSSFFPLGVAYNNSVQNNPLLITHTDLENHLFFSSFSPYIYWVTSSSVPNSYMFLVHGKAAVKVAISFLP